MTSTPLPRFDTRQATRARIMDVAMRRGSDGCTADELASAWGCSHNHVAPRCTELLKSGHLVATDRTRLTRASGSARVMVAAKFAFSASDRPASTITNSLFGDLAPIGGYPD